MRRFTDGNATFEVEVQGMSGLAPFLHYVHPQSGSLCVSLSPLMESEMADEVLAVAASGAHHFLSMVRDPLGEKTLEVWHVELARVLRGQGIPSDMALYLGQLLGDTDWGATVVPTLLGLGVEVHDDASTGLNSVEVFARTILLVGQDEAIRLFTERGNSWGEQRVLLDLLDTLGETGREHLSLVDTECLDALVSLVELGDFEPQEVSVLVSLMGRITPASLPRMGETLVALEENLTQRLATLFPEHSLEEWLGDLALLRDVLRPRTRTAQGFVYRLSIEDRMALVSARNLLLAPLLVVHGIGDTMAALGTVVENAVLEAGKPLDIERVWSQHEEAQATNLLLEDRVPIPLLMAAANGLADMGREAPLTLILALEDMDLVPVHHRTH